VSGIQKREFLGQTGHDIVIQLVAGTSAADGAAIVSKRVRSTNQGSLPVHKRLGRHSDAPRLTWLSFLIAP
jgi:hypothetical protein